MSYMSDCYNDIVDLVGDAIEAGAYYVNDVVEYVNARSRFKIDREMADSIIRSLDSDYDINGPDEQRSWYDTSAELM